MRLYIDTMDAVLVDWNTDGTVRLDDEDWRRPTLQERRAIIHAARREIDGLTELAEMLDRLP